MTVRIGHASADERGKASGGAAGDQTGKELCIRSWYRGNWKATLIAGGCTFCLIGSFYFDWFHYDTYVPDEKNVESVSVSFRT